MLPLLEICQIHYCTAKNCDEAPSLIQTKYIVCTCNNKKNKKASLKSNKLYKSCVGLDLKASDANV